MSKNTTKKRREPLTARQRANGTVKPTTARDIQLIADSIERYLAQQKYGFHPRLARDGSLIPTTRSKRGMGR